MSNQATISIQVDDGTYKQITCRWNGLPAECGSILLKHFSTPESINELMDLGNLAEIANTTNLSIYCIRDRDELTEVVTYPEFECDLTDCEYNYLFKNGKWFIQSDEYSDKNFFPFTFDVFQHEEKYIDEGAF